MCGNSTPARDEREQYGDGEHDDFADRVKAAKQSSRALSCRYPSAANSSARELRCRQIESFPEAHEAEFFFKRAEKPST